MSSHQNEKVNIQQFSNYAVGFVDLLGQRDEYKDQGLLPVFNTPEDRQAFIDKARKTVGAIMGLQELNRQFLGAAMNRGSSPLRELLREKQRKEYDELAKINLKTQHWSDGLVYFASLEAGGVKVPMNAIFNMVIALGGFCFIGLASGRPVRGGVESAWATELAPGDLSGCAVVKAYEIESKIAQYPRIVVGPYFLDYLHKQSQNAGMEYHARLNKMLADICLGFLLKDVDGQCIIHYLGGPFRAFMGKESHSYVYAGALKFVQESLSKFRDENNTKLLPRYSQLLDYFVKHAPAED